jgi:hypothetical protein
MGSKENMHNPQEKLFHGQKEVGRIDAEGYLEEIGHQNDVEPIIESVLPFVLKNSLPEGERYETLVLNSRHNIDSPMDVLQEVDELQGNFSINKPDRRIYTPFPQMEDEVVYAINNLSADMFFAHSDARLARKPSFSGYQDKFTAKAYLLDGKLCVGPVDVNKEFGNVIIKPGNKLPFVAENEFVCMRLAGKSGLDVPHTFLLQHSDPELRIKHFCIERFDFCYAPQLKKRDMMEFASIMRLDSQSKYSAQTEELFQIAEETLDEDNIKKLARTYFFGILTGNGDMHTKNFSVFVENGKCFLTPVYDMVNTEVHGFPDILALPMNENSNPNPSMHSIVEFLERYIDKEEMYYMTQNIKQNLPHVLDLALPQEEEIKFLEQSRIKFRQNLENSILNRVEAIEKIVL